MAKQRDTTCSIARSLEVLGERWTLLVAREALYGTTRFADFTTRLGIATDVLTTRLNTLVDAGIMERRPYADATGRERSSYHLTPAGMDLRIVISALQQWGDQHRPYPGGPTILRRTGDGRPVHVGYVDDEGSPVHPDDVRSVLSPSHPHYGEDASPQEQAAG
jgi:DNA-binding HxlR family transcriptional regulator